MENGDINVSFDERNDGFKSQAQLAKREIPFLPKILMNLGVKDEKTANKILFAVAIALFAVSAYMLIDLYKPDKIRTFDDLSELEKQSIPFELRRYLERQ